MSTSYSLIKNLRMLSAGLVLCSTLPAYGANIGACRQPTPHPHAADGVCRPKRETWGTYHTQWRPWPGDVIAQPKATGEETPGDADSLKGFQPPSPRDEDLRGPAKSKKAKGSGDSSDDSSDIDVFDIDAPAGDETLPAVPGFETQGQQFFDPNNEPNNGPTLSLQLPIARNVVRSTTQDAIAQHVTMLSVEGLSVEELSAEEEPEAALRSIPLPISLRSQEFLGADPFATISDQLPELGSEPMPGSRDQDLPPALPPSLRFMQATSTNDLLGTATPSAQPMPHAKAPVQNRVQRAAWNQPSGVIRLINPAAASVTPAGDNALKQAVYYEATDQPVDTPSR